jgi:integrase
MAIRKRGETWQIDYFDPAGKRVRVNFKRRKEAEDELSKRKSLIAEGRYLDVKKESRTTFGEAVKAYEEAFSRQASYPTAKRRFLRKFVAHFGAQTTMGSVTFADFEKYRNQLLALPACVPMRDGREVLKGARTNAATNREMSCLRHLFKKAKSWGLIEKSPFVDGESLLLKENNKRLRYLTEEEAARLVDACTPHLRPIVTFCLHTGARHQEAVGLMWHQIAGGFVHFDKTKTDESRMVPLNEHAQAALEAIRPKKAGGKVVDLTGQEVPAEQPQGAHVFTFRGKPVADVDIAFKGACRRAGIPFGRKTPGGITFHDLRHTFASWLAIAGVPIKTIQELLGHKNITMTMRYAHLSEKVKREAVNVLPSLRAVSDCHKTVTKAV